MLTVASWLWGWKYDRSYVAKLVAGVKRNLRQPHRFIAMTDRELHVDGVLCYPIPEHDKYLLDILGCFARLRAFDVSWQHRVQVHERLVCLDLDCVITGPLDALFDRLEPFVILQDINSTNPCPYNGSLWMLQSGYRPDVWSDFSLEAAAKTPIHAFADDQGWFEHKLPNAAAWRCADGVYGFKKRGWPSGDGLPDNARIVAFPGWRDPSKFSQLPWVREHWRV